MQNTQPLALAGAVTTVSYLRIRPQHGVVTVVIAFKYEGIKQCSY